MLSEGVKLAYTYRRALPVSQLLFRENRMLKRTSTFVNPVRR